MNKVIFGLICAGLIAFPTMGYVTADWLVKKGEPKQDVWQESCSPILWQSTETCQQANFIIKQNAEMIQLLGDSHNG